MNEWVKITMFLISINRPTISYIICIVWNNKLYWVRHGSVVLVVLSRIYQCIIMEMELKVDWHIMLVDVLLNLWTIVRCHDVSIVVIFISFIRLLMFELIRSGRFIIDIVNKHVYCYFFVGLKPLWFWNFWNKLSTVSWLWYLYPVYNNIYQYQFTTMHIHPNIQDQRHPRLMEHMKAVTEFFYCNLDIKQYQQNHTSITESCIVPCLFEYPKKLATLQVSFFWCINTGPESKQIDLDLAMKSMKAFILLIFAKVVYFR